ncbi:UbiA prenyltransferase family protein [Mycobacterium szulgai]|uniref:Ubiquinone biosynthesis protein UbiA n=1 Tax=Mycobacterium szulgai TaxID=1787 RepID=A0A1X2E7S0_MYCSZ|nr:UbiA prenyltransferase family protein [Mycobacterium szulgai]MCV7079906.1 UbiA prenyltransferase family protein [Mycobacterium szulgai]ORW96298.1 ubiquinone biosynthesis protein UbiA [Mycobacterium szulgai]
MKEFFALSRTVHGVLDLATPAVCAGLALGSFPRWQVILLAVFVGFSAYTAIYALNDLVGKAVDEEKFAGGINAGYSVEASELRYPLAQKALSLRKGILWFALWFIAAIIGSYFLNPAIVVILVTAAVLEVVYVLLLKITYWRTVVSGLVKSSGPISAIFAVAPKPSAGLVLLVLAWVFSWEVGGQNVPADWNDTVEDKRVDAKTIPLELGTETAGKVVLFALGTTVVTSLCMPLVSPLQLGVPYVLASAVIGAYFLLIPAWRLHRAHEGRQAAKLFDSASYYPLALLLLIIAFVLIK